MVESRHIRGGYALLLLLLVACETDDPAGPSGPARAPALAAIEVPLLQTPALGATEVSTAPTFSWSSITGANRYWLVVATSEVALPVDPNGTSCSGRCVIDANRKRTNFSPNTPLEPGTTYYWKVLPWNTDGTRGEFSITGSFTTAGVPGPPDPTPIQAPQLLTPSSAATGVSTMPTFSWSSVAGANRYWLTVATSEAALPVDPNATSCSGTCVIDRNRGRTRFTPPTHLDPRTTYYWKVLPWNTDGTRGDFSRTGSFTTTMPPPPPPPPPVCQTQPCPITLRGEVTVNGIGAPGVRVDFYGWPVEHYFWTTTERDGRYMMTVPDYYSQDWTVSIREPQGVLCNVTRQSITPASHTDTYVMAPFACEDSPHPPQIILRGQVTVNGIGAPGVRVDLDTGDRVGGTYTAPDGSYAFYIENTLGYTLGGRWYVRIHPPQGVPCNVTQQQIDLPVLSPYVLAPFICR